MIKLGFDAKRLFHNSTGLGNYSRTLVQNLLLHYPEINPYLYSPKISQQYDFPNAHIRHAARTPAFWWRSFSLPSVLKKDNIQIYHGLSNELPFGLHKTGIKSVVTIHDLIFRHLPDTYPFIDRKIYDIKFSAACRQADKIIAVSKNTKQDIIADYGIEADKVEVIYQACHPLFYGKIEVQKEDFMLYVGSVVQRKNLLSIVQAYQYLHKDFQVPLYIVGAGKAYKKQVEKAIAASGIQDKFRWIQTNSIEELRQLYLKARIFIYPSVYEGFGIPIAEALLSKTPVITGNNSALPEAGGPDAYYVDAKESEAIAQGIEKILSDDAYRNGMVESGHDYAQKTFSPSLLSRQLMDLYQSLLY